MIKFNKKAISYILAFLMILNIGLFRRIVNAQRENGLSIQISNYQDVLKTKDKKNLDSIIFQYWNLGQLSEYENFEEEDYKKLSNELESLTEKQLNIKFSKPHLSPPSDKFGNVNIKDLQKNLYYFREFKQKEKYVYVVPFFVLIVEDNNFVEIETKSSGNVPGVEYGNVRLIKKSDSDKLLEGVGFDLYNISENGENRVLLNESGNYFENGEYMTLYTDKNGEIIVNGLPVGRYIFREVEPLSGYKIIQSDIIFEIIKNETIDLRIVNEKIPTDKGKYKFLKISDDKNKTPLEGVQFKVTIKNDNLYEDVLKNGKTYFVKSDKNGQFIVEDLPYGKYYLWETKAPKDYIQLSNSIEFEIDKDSESKVLIITNKKKPPIDIPDTGDMLIILILISSIVIFGVGFKMSRQDQ